MIENIEIKGAKENNLKNVDLTIPKNKLVVFTGVSGSGKSTLAFDTIFAEGQRRYMESLSSYARMFLGQMKKPDVDSITGLSPSVAIDQKTTSNNPRSTVGTVTEIYDYLRLIFAHIGTPYCPNCNKEIATQNIDSIIDKIMQFESGAKIIIKAPLYMGKKGTFVKEIRDLLKDGFVRAEIDGEIIDLSDEISLDKNIKHNISVVIDRLIIKEGIERRLTESVESALKLADGVVVVKKGDEDILFSTKHACATCGYSIGEISPRIFSFNSPFGACEECSGLGFKQIYDVNKIVRAPNLSLLEGAISSLGWNDGTMSRMFYNAVCEHFNEDIRTPFKNLSEDCQNMILYGTNGEKIKAFVPWINDYKGIAFEGVINNIDKRAKETQSERMKQEYAKLLIEKECPLCHGDRLNKNALNIKINKKNIVDVCDLSVSKALEFFKDLKLSKSNEVIAKPLLKEIVSRLEFLENVGLNYLTLSRKAGTLSGGEAQRIRLATQIGSGLTGVIYILDEPSIGLHQRDNDKLIQTLLNLRDLGNTVIVVEHDTDTMQNADQIVDIGPFAGVHGGKIIAQGSVEEIKKCGESLTGQYLNGTRKIEVPINRREINRGYFSVLGAKQNNLKNIDVEIPIGVVTAVTGVSGSGKSSLVNGIIFPAAYNHVYKSNLPEGKYKKIEGIEQFDKVINIDQSPIGRTPRSNPATYVGVFNDIRDLFAQTADAKERGFLAGRFSFNVAGGRCECCGGAGIKKVEMFFLPDVYVQCDCCAGKRYNRETLQVKYKGKNIHQVLEMTFEEACKFFENVPKIKNKLQTVVDVGLGYIKLGQPATELSGGEAQRVKLATELSKRATGKSFYLLDEPTTGLHLYDVEKLLNIINRLADAGNTILIIEHNLDVIKCADYIIDLGPEGGENGGLVIAKGTPEQIVKIKNSETAKYLKDYLKK